MWHVRTKCSPDLLCLPQRRALIPITVSYRTDASVRFFIDEHGRVIRLFADRVTQHVVAESFIEW